MLAVRSHIRSRGSQCYGGRQAHRAAGAPSSGYIEITSANIVAFVVTSRAAAPGAAAMARK